MVSACGTHSNATPSASSRKTRVVFSYYAPWAGFTVNATTTPLIEHIFQPFRDRHQTVDLVLNLADAPNNIPQQIASGTGPDVFWSNLIGPLVDHGYILDLTPYLKQDNIKTDIFLTSQLAQYQHAGSLYALPAYAHVLSMVINEGLFDQLGLQYPAPDWTHLDFLRLAEATTGRSGQAGNHRYGASLMAWPTAMPDAFYFHGFGGSYIDPANRQRCALDTAESLACGEFLFSMILDGVATTNWGTAMQQWFPQGLVGILSNWHLPFVNVNLFSNMKWNYYPQPVWPKGPATFVNSDFLAINAATKVADVAWEVLRYTAVEPQLQKSVMKLTGFSPSLKSLLTEWVAVLRSLAPPLRSKNLEVYEGLVYGNRAFPGMDFAHADGQAKTLIGDWAQKIMARGVSVQGGLRQAAAQVNLLEAAASAAYRQQQALTNALKVGAGGSYPRPAATGAGAAAVADPGLATLHAGGVVLTGTGAAVGASTDGFSFAATPALAVDGTYTCRVTAIREVGTIPPQQWAMAGLMARSDLSDQSTMILLTVTRAHGLVLEVRPTPTAAPQIQIGSGGLLPAAKVSRKVAQGKAGYLRQPVWLRLQRKATAWTAFTSLDGKKWTVAGTPVDLKMAGCWIGTFASAYNGSSGAAGRVQASFDNLGGFALHSGDVWQVGRP